MVAELETGVIFDSEEVQIVDNEASYLEMEAADTAYETELVISTLTMSDLDELRPLLIDEIVL